MFIWQSVVLGIIEGATEFLPISSTFHLLFTMRWLSIPNTEFNNFFAVFIQSAAILAVVLLFFREWLQDKKLLWNVAISFIPTGIVGFLLHKAITTVFFSSSVLMLSASAGVGVVFLILEWFIRHDKLKLEKVLSQISVREALLIGLVQAAAVVPGVSRAGAVMVVMMLMGYKRDQAAKYSFTLAIPTILGAAVFDVYKTRAVLLTTGNQEFVILAVGSVTAFLSALIIVRWFIQFLRTHSLVPFGIYRLLATALLAIFGFWH